MSGTIFGITFGYLIGYTERTYSRISKRWNYCRFNGVALGCGVGQIFESLLVIRDGPSIGLYFSCFSNM